MIALILKQIRYCFLPLIMSFLITGCSIVGESIKSKGNISIYAELLFKRQNLMTQQVMMLFEEDITESDDIKISLAEEQMHEACHLLNEYANREAEGKSSSLFFRRRLQKSFKDCEEKVIQLELVLKDRDSS